MKVLLMITTHLLVVGAAAAAEIEVEDPWARASLGRAPNSAAYMTIRSDAPDRLLGASSPVAERVELHSTTMEGEIARMRPLESLEVAPDRPANLRPGGTHLMLMGLRARLSEGETFPLELTFEQAGTVEIEAEVRGLGATTGAGHGSGHGGGHGTHGGAGG